MAPLSNEASFVEQLKVEVDEPVLIHAMEDTPKGPLFLSNLDLAVMFPVETLYVYPSKLGVQPDDLIERMKSSLERLLVHYYFIAGRLEWNKVENRLQIDCNNGGVLFAGASCELTLDVIGDITHPSNALTTLILRPHSALTLTTLQDLPLLTVQVTVFKCGSFVVGFSMYHILFDGIGAAEFVVNYASFTRGEGLVVKPDPDRKILCARSPPCIKYDHHELIPLPLPPHFSEELILHSACHFVQPSDKHVYKTLSVPKQMLAGLKKLGGKSCTSFETITAHVWKCRTIALEMKSDDMSSVSFAVDIRQSLTPPLPNGFAGMAIVEACAILKAGEVKSSPLSYLAEKVREAKERVKEEEYIRSTLDYLEVHPGATVVLPTGFNISSWWRIPFHEADFGWGKPVHAGPVTSAYVELVLFLENGKSDGSLNVYVALQPHQLLTFEELFFKPSQDIPSQL